MQLVTAIVELVGSLAWPLTLLILVALFRREIRQRLAAVKELKFPGGSVKMVEEQVAATIASGEDSITKRIEATIERQLADVNRELANSIRSSVLKDVKDTFQTLQLRAGVVTELAESAAPPPAPAARPGPVPSLHPGAPQVIRWIARNEGKYEFFSVKFLREKVFAADPIAQQGLQFCIRERLVELYHLPNPNNPDHPTKACRLNRSNGLTIQLLR